MSSKLFTFWGKAHEISGKFSSHPALFHMLDVAACAGELYDAEAQRFFSLQRRYKISSGSLRGQIIRLVALHDIGKFGRGFQAKVPALWPPFLGLIPDHPPQLRHDAAGVQMLLGKLAADVEPLFSGYTGRQKRMLVTAVCGHHGEPVEADMAGDPSETIGRKSIDAAREATRALLEILPPCEQVELSDDAIAALSHMLAGLTVVADWIGSNREWFKFESPLTNGAVEDNLRDYWETMALPRAKIAVLAAGLAPVAVTPFAGSKTFLDGNPPTPLQVLAEQVDLGVDGPQLVIVEDMTGAGKTEAALILAHRLIASGAARGAHIALPTQATADAMFKRLGQHYRKFFEPGQTPSISLFHSKRDLVEGFRRIQGAIATSDGNESRRVADASERTASAFCADWIARSNKQAFLAQIGAGTIDQALLAVLPARHQSMRLWGLSDKVLIVDEAHAYDAYMSRELEALLQFQAALGGSAIILSATLPKERREALSRAFQKGLSTDSAQKRFEAQSDAYPLVTVVANQRADEIASELRPGLDRTVHIERADAVEQAEAAVLEAARAGGAVALIRNTVDEAVESWRRLSAAFDGETLLFHARFAMTDRLDAEKRALDKFGRDSANRTGILVATQVVEQSLDLDFDFMASDLAPIDLIIQRAGRLWRHPGRSRTQSAPRLCVISPEPTDDANEKWLDRVLPKTTFVYGKDAALLWRSARALFEAGGIVSCTRANGANNTLGEIRALIEAAYGDTFSLPEGLETNANVAAGNDIGARAKASHNVLRFDNGYDRHGNRWDDDARIATRLQDDVSVVFRLALFRDEAVRPLAAPDNRQSCRRDWALSEISLRANRCSGVPTPPQALAWALDAARADWSLSEREMPVMILEPVPGGWCGKGIRKNEIVDIFYSSQTGLSFSDRENA